MALQLKSVDETRYDAIALGEILMRIDPGQVPTARARSGRIWHGGGETNVAEGLSYCFGLRAAVLTALVDDGIGRKFINQGVREFLHVFTTVTEAIDHVLTSTEHEVDPSKMVPSGDWDESRQ